MPSAVAAKVADLLSKYNRPRTAASLRPSPSSHRRPASALKLHKSADFTHSRLKPQPDSDDDLLNPPPPRPPPTRRHPSSSRPSDSPDGVDSPHPVDEWEEEMKDEFGVDDLHSAPLRRAPRRPPRP